MNKHQLIALVLIAICVVVFVLTRGSVEVNLIVTKVRAASSFVFLGFTAVGVAIGVLLK